MKALERSVEMLGHSSFIKLQTRVASNHVWLSTGLQYEPEHTLFARKVPILYCFDIFGHVLEKHKAIWNKHKAKNMKAMLFDWIENQVQ